MLHISWSFSPVHLSLINHRSSLSKLWQAVRSLVCSHISPPLSTPPIFLHTGVCKCPLTLRHKLMERQNRPVCLLSAQWIAPVLQLLAECLWLIPGPRTAPDTRSMSACVYLDSCLVIFSECAVFLKENKKKNTLCHQTIAMQFSKPF